MTDPVRVAIVDDDALVRAGLQMMLDGVAGLSVVGEADDGNGVFGLVDAHSPDVVLMDIRMPRLDGIAATERLRARPHPPEVIMLTTFDTDDNVLLALRAGASGFLLKDSRPEQIVAAIRKVAAGDPMLSPQVTRRLMDRAASQADTYDVARASLAKLTAREREVVLSVAEGSTNAEISAKLFMSVATVKAHVSTIMAKLDLTNRTQIALLAHDAGLA